MTPGKAQRLCLAALVLILTAAPAAGEPPSEGKAPVPRLKPVSMEGDPRAGEKAYLERCWACHGLTGDGQGPGSAGMKPPPTDFTASDALRGVPVPALLDAILKGKPGTSMYPQGVDPQTAVDLVAFLRTLPRSDEAERNLLDSLAHADKEAGRVLYNRRCWPCHGPNGSGDGPAAPALKPPPADFTDPDLVARRTAARLYEVLSRGIPGTAMSAQDLSEQDKFNLIAYLRSLVRYDDQRKTREEPLAQGVARKGKELYEKRCWACHGSAGEGDGPAAIDMIPAPTRFSDYDAMKGRADQDWYNAIQWGIPGTAMYPQRITPAEILNLIAYLRTLGRRAPESPPAKPGSP